VAPNDFRTPISRVRSETETNMIFINAIDEPKIVIIPITQSHRQPLHLKALHC
jgi:hypothetical protein